MGRKISWAIYHILAKVRTFAKGISDNIERRNRE